jgi:AcrR family transcriptional regulator
MPRATGVRTRPRLIEAAMQLVEEGGPEAVQARKVAAAVGASTMAVYTYFGGVSELLEAVVREGYRRFGVYVSDTPKTDDPLTDFFVQGMAYREWALGHPQLYRLIFGLTGAALPRRVIQDMTMAGTPSLLAEGQGAFRVLFDSIDRVKAQGKIDEVNTVAAAGQFLSATHGYVLLEIAGLFDVEGQGFAWVFGPLGMSVMVGLGASREDVERAAVAALASRGIR